MGIFPKWVKELKWSDFWGGVKEDISSGTKAIGGTVKSALGGVRGILTPTIIWIFVVLIIALIILVNYKKVLRF